MKHELSNHAISQMLNRLSDPAPPRDFAAGVLARVRAERAARSRERRIAFFTLALSTLAAAICLISSRDHTLAELLADHLHTLAAGFVLARASADALSPVVDSARLPIALVASSLSVALLITLQRILPTRDLRRSL